jgi:hypothetical protein
VTPDHLAVVGRSEQPRSERVLVVKILKWFDPESTSSHLETDGGEARDGPVSGSPI